MIVDLLVRNARLATMDGPGYGVREDAAFAIHDGRIVWIGAEHALPDADVRDTLDAGGAWITPGFVDAHTHLVYAGDRSREFEQRLEGATYEEIARAGGGILSTVRATRAASDEHLLALGIRRAERLRAEGVTTLEIKSGYGLDLETEMRALRIARTIGERCDLTVRTTYLGAHALGPEFVGRPDAYIDYVCGAVLPQIARAGLADRVDAFCETIAFTPAQTARFFDAARACGLGITLHADQLSDSGGAEVAARYGAQSADHLEYTSDDGVAALAAAGTVAVLLPGAFYVLREKQLPPIAALRAAGVPIALATDSNPGTSPIESILLILNLACTLFRLTAAEALAGITRCGAQALGLGHEIGTLTCGKYADFTLWDIDHPAQLAYAIGVNPARAVYRRGRLRPPSVN